MKPLKGGLAAGLQLGSLGFKVKGVSPRDVIADSEYFAEILARNKMIGFIGLNPSEDEHMAILKALYRGDNEDPPVGLIHDQKHSGNPHTETDQYDDFVYSQWHVDNPFNEIVPSYTSMHMQVFNVPEGNGSTVLASLETMYQECPVEFRTKLGTAYFIHATGSVNGNEDWGAYAHQALRTHPYTGETSIFWTGWDTRLPNPEPWFDDFKEWVKHFLGDKRNWYRWYWKKGDFIIWDNRSVIHALEPGWRHDQRIFSRGDVGMEKPFYSPGRASKLNPMFGDVVRHSSVKADLSKGPNPDHIPLVFTKGIYALPDYQHLYQQTTMFVYSDDGSMPDDVQRFKEAVDNPEFNVELVKPEPGNFLDRYSKQFLPGAPLVGQKFLFTPNGNLEKAYHPDDDLFTDEFDSWGRWPPIRLVNALGEFHPDLRHAGHAWHYPDWFPTQPLKERPWDWRNLSFFSYEGFPGSQPPEDFLVQFAVDTVYGCFNHLQTDEERKQLIERIIDYLQFMIELGEHKIDR